MADQFVPGRQGPVTVGKYIPKVVNQPGRVEIGHLR